MSEMLKEGFSVLLAAHGETWRFGKAEFKAVAQSGAYAAYNFIDGNTGIKILRYKTDALAVQPVKGDQISNAYGQTAFVRQARRIDGDFSEMEVDEI